MLVFAFLFLFLRDADLRKVSVCSSCVSLCKRKKASGKASIKKINCGNIGKQTCNKNDNHHNIHNTNKKNRSDGTAYSIAEQSGGNKGNMKESLETSVEIIFYELDLFLSMNVEFADPCQDTPE